MRTRRWSLVPSLEAEFVLGVRLAARHPVARSALVWTIGLAAVVRVVGGGATPDRTPPTMIALAGLLAAAVAPPLFVRGGPLEALRWSRGRLVAACLARLHGALTVALLAAVGAGVVLGGRWGASPAVIGVAVLHAVVVGSLAGALAPRAGCAFSTAFLVLMVAVGAGASEVGTAEPVSRLLIPPGALGVRLLVGGGGHVALTAWIVLGVLGVWSLARRAGPVPPRMRGLRARV
jgi:hypothetical protein